MMWGTTSMSPRFVIKWSLSALKITIFLQGKIQVDSIDDKEDMQFADEAFDILGFSEEEKFNVYKVRMTGATITGKFSFDMLSVDTWALFGHTARIAEWAWQLAFRGEVPFIFDISGFSS